MEPSSSNKRLSVSESEDPGSSNPFAAAQHTYSRTGERNAQDNQASPPSFLQFIGNIFRGGARPEHNGHSAALPAGATLKGVLQTLLEEHAEDNYDPTVLPEEYAMLRNILRFGEMTVNDIMIPRADIVAVESDIELDELKQTIVQERHSRIPVYYETLDHINGFIHIKDLAVQVFSGNNLRMNELLREILFVPPSMKVIDLLLKMRLSSVHIAIVVDEYGGTDGLVTMEDIMEEIVGNIRDEHDEEPETDNFTWLDTETIEADARMEIGKLQECLGGQLVLEEDEGEFDTIGGLVFSQMGRVPEAGESVEYPTGLRITILEADARSVKRVRIKRFQPIQEELLSR